MFFSLKKRISIVPLSVAGLSLAALIPLSSIGSELDAQKANQLAIEETQRLAKSSGAKLTIIDHGRSHTTSMLQPPAAISAMIVYDEKGIDILLDALLPYYGFTGNEELRYVEKIANNGQTVYLVQQFIDSIETTAYIRIRVDDATARVTAIRGYLYNSKGLEKQHHMTNQTAVVQVVDHVQKLRNGKSATNDEGRLSTVTGVSMTAHKISGNHQSMPLYRNFGDVNELRAWWGVGIELEEPVKIPNGEVLYDWYLVDPEGNVMPWIDGDTAYSVPTNESLLIF